MRYALTLLVALFGPMLAAQDVPDDRAFQALLDRARTQAAPLDGAERDAFWQAFADSSFALYRSQPATPSGRAAARKAFQIWGNDGTIERVETALALLPDTTDILDAPALYSVSLTYARQGAWSRLETTMTRLAARLTQPASRIALRLNQGRRLSLVDDADEARRLYSEVARLAAVDGLAPDSTAADEAAQFLYALDHLLPGHRLPALDVPTLAGDTLRLGDLHGRVVVLDLWATWCTPCYADLPVLDALHTRYGPDRVAVVSLSFDSETDDLVRVIAEREMDWLQLHEPESFLSPVARRYAVYRLPTTFVLDGEGRIVARDVRGEALLAAVEALVESGPTTSESDRR